MKKYTFLSVFFLLSMLAVPFTTAADDYYRRGDANGDGTVNIKDVTSLIDYLLNGQWQDGDPQGDDPYSNRVLNILAIGNSLSEDAWAYVPYILQEYGISVRMMIFRKSATNLSNLVEHYYEPWGSSVASAFDRGKMLYIDTTGEIKDELGNTAEIWKVIYNDLFYDFMTEYNASYVPSDYAVEDGVLWNNTKWDVIALLDFPDHTFVPKTSDLETLIGYIKNSNPLLKSSVFALQVSPTFSSYGATYFHSSSMIAKNHTMYNNSSINMVFPNCTAIANARQIPELQVLGEYGDLIADGVHLQGGLPCYLSALTCVEALFRRYYPWLSVKGNTNGTRYDDEWAAGKNIPNEQVGGGQRIPVTPELAPICQRIAALANDYPWKILDEGFIRDSTLTVTMHRDVASGFELAGSFPKSNAAVGGVGDISVPKYSSVSVMIRPSGNSQAVLGSCKLIIGGEWNGSSWVGGMECDLPIENNTSGFYLDEVKDNIFIQVTPESK